MSVTLTRRCKLMKSIKNRREHIGLTQAQFASSLQVSRATVAMWRPKSHILALTCFPRLHSCSAAPSTTCTRTSQ